MPKPRRPPRPVRCVDTGEEFEDVWDAANVYTIDPEDLARAILCRNKVHGLTFEYVRSGPPGPRSIVLPLYFPYSSFPRGLSTLRVRFVLVMAF
eukprot:g10025.t1